LGSSTTVVTSPVPVAAQGLSGARGRPVTVAQLRARGRARFLLGLLGPAFVASVAYVDPGNVATNFAGGAALGYQLAWVIMLANLTALLVQYLTAKAGLATGASLPELCRARYGRRANVALWAQAEAVAIATDLAEIVGAAVGLNLLFGMPLLMGGVVTLALAFGVLALEQRGYRRYEVAVVVLLAMVGAGFGYLFLVVGGQDYGAIAGGMVPRLAGPQALSLTVAIIGATVMPHVVYLHSALHKNRVVAASPAERRLLATSNKWDCWLGLGGAGVLNLVMLCVAAAMFRHGGPATLDFSFISGRLAAVAGGGAALAFGVALLASGVSASTVGTHAGQVVMAGFTRWRVPLVARRAVTAIPALVILALPVSTGQVLIYSQVVLSFGIPFALVPLLAVTRDRSVMGDMVNARSTSAAMLAATALITVLNVVLLAQLAGL
jgi:manganese transport protein